MTRIELISSDEYVTASVDCLVRSNVVIKVIRRDVAVNWVKHKDELLEHAKQTVIEFCLWSWKGDYKLDEQDNTWYKNFLEEHLTTEQLYELFVQSQPQNKNPNDIPDELFTGYGDAKK